MSKKMSHKYDKMLREIVATNGKVGRPNPFGNRQERRHKAPKADR